MRRGRALATGLAMCGVFFSLAPSEAASVPKVFQCTGDAYVTNYNIGDPVNDATSGFFFGLSSLFCHDEQGQSDYTGTIDTLRGSVQGSGWCADPTSTEPGNITIRAEIAINITREATGAAKRLKHWKLIRTITGRSDAPVPGNGSIIGKVRLPGGVGNVGTFLIEPFDTLDDCYHQFQIVRFYNLVTVPAPGA